MQGSTRQKTCFWLTVQIGVPLILLFGIAFLEKVESGRPIVDSLLNGDLYLLAVVMLFGAGLEIWFEKTDIGIGEGWMLLAIFLAVVVGAILYSKQIGFVSDGRESLSNWFAWASLFYLIACLPWAYSSKYRVIETRKEV